MSFSLEVANEGVRCWEKNSSHITIFSCYISFFYSLLQNVAKVNPTGNTENEPAMSIDHNFQDIKVTDTSEHKITSTNKKIG